MKKKIWKIIIAIFLVFVVFGTYVYFYHFGWLMDMGMKLTANMKRSDPSKGQAAYTVTADDFYKEFKTDSATASNKYNGKAVQISGSVTSIDGIHVSLGNVTCTVDSTQLPKVTTIKTGDNVKLQGLVTGYAKDEFMGMDEVDLSQCAFK